LKLFLLSYLEIVKLVEMLIFLIGGSDGAACFWWGSLLMCRPVLTEHGVHR